VIIEGRNAVIEALRAKMPLERVMISSQAEVEQKGPIADIERLAQQARVPIQKVGKRDLDRVSERGAHQGVMAVAAPYQFAQLDNVLRKVAGKENALVIILDHVTDPGNLGAIARSAEVVGAAALVVPKRRSAALTPAAWKAAAGALAHINVVQEANVSQVLRRLKEENFWAGGADGDNGTIAWDAPMNGRLALVMGSEGDGLARLTRDNCDFLVRLPQAGRVGSLNVAQATTALSYEWLRQTSLPSAT